MEHQIHLGIWHDIPIFIMCFGYQLLTPTHRFESHTTKDRSKGKTRQLEPSELEEVTILWYEISGRCFLGFKTTPVNSISDNMCIYISLKLISCACGSNIFNINIQTFSDFPTLSNISEWFSQKKKNWFSNMFQHCPINPEKNNLVFPWHVDTISSRLGVRTHSGGMWWPMISSPQRLLWVYLDLPYLCHEYS